LWFIIYTLIFEDYLFQMAGVTFNAACRLEHSAAT